MPEPLDLAAMMDFLEEEDGFDSPPIPSTKHPKSEGGRVYHVPSPDAKTGLRLSALADLAMKRNANVAISELDVKRLRLDDEDEREFIEQTLSSETVEEMVADGVKWDHVRRLAQYAFTFFAVGREAADEAARRGLFSGKGMTPTNRAERRAKPKAKRKGSTAAS